MNEILMWQIDFRLKSTSNPHTSYLPDVDWIHRDPIVLNPLTQNREQSAGRIELDPIAFRLRLKH